jgi:hypothetical protein
VGFEGEVERGLAAERGQERVGALAFDDGGERVDIERLDVGTPDQIGVRHDRGGVRVDEDDVISEPAQRLGALGTGVVELARLTDHDRS